MDIKISEKKCKKKVVKKVIVDDKVDDEKEQTLPEKKVVVKKIPIDEKLFTEGHINAAQLTAMNEGKGMLEVIALSAKTTGAPKGGATNDDVIALNENQKSVASTLGLTDEEFNATEL